jgi:predicted GNAT family acetyltransferase
MRVIRDSDVASFLEKVGPHLRPHPAENNLMLGLLGDLVRAGTGPSRETEYAKVSLVLLFVEGARGNIEAVALQTPPRAIVVSRASNEAVDALVDFAISTKVALSGVVGPSETADRFASTWGARTGRAPVLRMDEIVYELGRMRPPAPCAGRLREATAADEPLLAAWSGAFIAETTMDSIPDCRAFVRAKVAARQLFVWDADGPVSMAAWMGRTEQGVRVGYVYTPPAERKKGYASAVVAALSQRLLDEGIPRCFLFTQAANPTSNKIYQALGYERVCDFRLYHFPAF